MSDRRRGDETVPGSDRDPSGETRPRGDDETVETALEQSIDEGIARLRRSWPELLSTGVVGGFDLSLGILGLYLVRYATGSRQLAGLAFSIGFIALVLAKSELFTENFLVPITAVVARNATVYSVVRLWFGTAVGNLAGGWVMTFIMIGAVPRLSQGVISDVGRHYFDLGIGWESFASAVLAGTVMTLMTWMERGTRSMLGKLTAAVSAAYLLAATPLVHSVVSSIEMFAALHADARATYGDWAGLFGWAVLGNMVGGIGLVTILRLVQVGRAKIVEEQQRPQPPGARE